MASSLLSIGASGLQAAQLGLSTTSHNIANVNTPGYSRQRTEQATNIPQYSGSGYFGQGTHVETVRRQYSQFLNVQVQATSSQLARTDATLSQLSAIDDLLADPAAGLSPALTAFSAGVNQLAQHPSDTASRQGLISQGSALVARFQLLDGQLNHLRDDVNSRVASSADAINGLSQQILEVNERIRQAQGNPSQPPNDLLDQRDQLVVELNKQVNASVVGNDDGSINVYLGNGQPLVVGTERSVVVAQRDPADPQRTIVGLKSGSTVVQFRSDDLNGGDLAGTLAFRETVLDPAQNALGRMAIALGSAFNAQHSVGQDLNGAMGGAFFAVASPVSLSDARNTGNATLGATIANPSALTTSDYQVAWDGTNWNVTRLSDGNVSSFATLPQTVDGVSLNVSAGTPNAGDRFLVQPTRRGATDFGVVITDPARVAAASPVAASSSAANLGTGAASAPTVSVPANTNLQQPVTITFTGPNTFNVTGTGTGNPTAVTFTPGADITYNGWTFRITGAPQAGDTFGVGPNTGGIGDNRNATALASLQDAKVLDGGTTTVTGAYARLVSDIGNRGRTLAATAEAQAKLTDQATAAQQEVSGVNLDEEAANLMRYQQAYSASAKVLQVAQTIFDELVHLGN